MQLATISNISHTSSRLTQTPLESSPLLAQLRSPCLRWWLLLLRTNPGLSHGSTPQLGCVANFGSSGALRIVRAHGGGDRIIIHWINLRVERGGQKRSTGRSGTILVDGSVGRKVDLVINGFGGSSDLRQRCWERNLARKA